MTLPSRATCLFYAVFATLCLLAAVPFWLTHLLPMQDYPHFLTFARALGDCRDPGSPFFGTYTTGFPLSPLALPLVLTRLLGVAGGLELGGRLVWTLYAIGLPASSLYLLHVLGRDRWQVLLVFPLVISYWVVDGFFAFASAAPLLVLGLAATVRWLQAPCRRRGLWVAALAATLFLWHALAWAELLLGAAALWLLWLAPSRRARLGALWPALPSLSLFALWLGATVIGRPPGHRPAAWRPLLDNAAQLLEPIGPSVPGAVGCVVLFLVLLLAGTLATRAPARSSSTFRVANPFAWLSLLAGLCYLVLPATCFGVEGINNRQPWMAALFFVFAWRLPEARSARATLLSAVGVLSALVLLHLGTRFRAFDHESEGASRLIDRLRFGDTLLAPIGPGSTASFPGKPLIALDLYATVRHGGLPNKSFAGYDINIIRYANDTNPMPGLGANWLGHPKLRRFDYVLLRGVLPSLGKRPLALRLEAQDGEWSLFAVCGSHVLPECS